MYTQRMQKILILILKYVAYTSPRMRGSKNPGVLRHGICQDSAQRLEMATTGSGQGGGAWEKNGGLTIKDVILNITNSHMLFLSIKHVV